MKQYDQRHQLRHGQAAFPRPMPLAISHQPGLELGFDRFVEVVHPAVSLGQIVHDEASVYVVDQVMHSNGQDNIGSYPFHINVLTLIFWLRYPELTLSTLPPSAHFALAYPLRGMGPSTMPSMPISLEPLARPLGSFLVADAG
ncbi:hypothetical protein [Accumulibacter sp.]|uniref:hypothetical protein n=1 Tax=Accumulibacter sp. TaxID=2053492 RepID=UPI00258A5A41|nr:hypothetical protein [Accumulibacter sp.]MCM8578118.1 hypothetical protein [Accumulibacter sp.]